MKIGSKPEPIGGCRKSIPRVGAIKNDMIYVSYKYGSHRIGTFVDGIPTVNGAIEGLIKAKKIRDTDVRDVTILEIRDRIGNRVYKAD